MTKLLLAALVGFAPTVDEPHEHDYSVAVMILFAPADAPVPPIPDKSVLRAIVRLAVLRDAVYTHQNLVWQFGDYTYQRVPQAAFATDVEAVRNNLGKPPLTDALAFPPYEVVKEELLKHQQYQKVLRKRLQWETDRAARIQAALADLEPVIDILVAAEMATHDKVSSISRRGGLAKLKKSLTPEAYFWGRLPNGVPE